MPCGTNTASPAPASTDAAVHGLDSALDSERSGSLEITRRLRTAYPGGPADTATFLRGLTPAQLLSVHCPGSVGIYLTPRPARDGVVLPVEPLTEVFASGRFNRVPVMLGSNRDEMRTFLADKAEHSKLLFGKVPVLHDRAAYIAESGLQSRAWRALHVDAPADAMLDGGHADVWTYRFDWDEAPAIPFIRPDILLGACHAMEMPFVFRDVAGEFDIFKVNTPFNRAGRGEVAQAMGNAWTSFARSGAPALPGGLRWARRDEAAQESLVFDSVRGGGLRMAALASDIQALKRELVSGAGDAPLAVRARLFARTFLWSPLFAGHADLHDYEQVRQRFGGEVSAEAYRPQVEV